MKLSGANNMHADIITAALYTLSARARNYKLIGTAPGTEPAGRTPGVNLSLFTAAILSAVASERIESD
jgi:hypothetical protein